MFRYSRPVKTLAWKSLTHAHGSAENVPAMLEDLCSDDSETRLDAYHDVISTLWHQGTIYQATAYAVPFLVELLCSSVAPCRGRAATALALIASSATHNASDNPTHAKHVVKELTKSVQRIVETAATEPTLRQITTVLLAQLHSERRIIEHFLETKGLTAELALLREAGISAQAAFKSIGQYGDESDPSDKTPTLSEAKRAESAKLVSADIDALNWDADWEE